MLLLTIQFPFEGKNKDKNKAAVTATNKKQMLRECYATWEVALNSWKKSFSGDSYQKRPKDLA